MTQYYLGRGARRQSGIKPFCARCGNVVEEPFVSQSRATWADAGRGLSLEIDGREGREVRRRHSSANLVRSAAERRNPLHCYIVPISNGTGGEPTLTSTYRESFSPPSSKLNTPRQVRSTPSSPVSTMSPWSNASPTSPFYTQRESVTPMNVQAALSRLPGRRRGSDASFERNKTTYMDHFTWIS